LPNGSLRIFNDEGQRESREEPRSDCRNFASITEANMSHMRHRFLLALPVCICLMFAYSISATATDFSPPPWDRFSETATFQEWEFLTAPINLPFGEGLAPDGASVGTNNPGARAIPIGLGLTLIGGMDGTFAWVDGFGPVPGVGAGVIQFDIPNRPG
jgi:hypothetical protein